MISKIILSPPFSNLYPDIKGTTRILGTYTLKKRKGMYRVLTTLRKTKGGWINNSGLRNPGILKYNKKNSIISISLEKIEDWDSLYYYLYLKNRKYNIKGIEFNISCPNHNIININDQIIKQSKQIFQNTIIKMPHNAPLSFIDEICNTEIDMLHVSNSKKTNKGALSGISLIEDNMLRIAYIKNKFDKKVIAGGGIYSFDDILRYKSVGADHFSLGTCLINPLKTLKIIKQMSQYQ